MTGSKQKFDALDFHLDNMETLTNKLATFSRQLTRTQVAFPAEIIETSEALLANSDFPTTRDEAWKYTRVNKIAGIRKPEYEYIFSENDLKQFIVNEESFNVIIVDGIPKAFFPLNNNQKGLSIKPLSTCSSEELKSSLSEFNLNTIFDHLNTLYLTDGILISTEKNVCPAPISLVHVCTGNDNIHHSRIIIEQDKNSKLEILQYYTSFNATNNYLNNVTSISLKPDAQLELYKIQHSLGNNMLISNEVSKQEKNSRLTIHTHTLDCGFVRNSCELQVKGENAETNLYGTYLLREKEHVDSHTCIDHQVANCLSNEKYKGVIGDSATAVFNGKVFVRENAQKINAFQSNANILTSPGATVNSKPELEIYADDVKCSHGSTTGQLDEEALFYLRARGLSEKSAKDLLIEAFLGDVVNEVKNESAKTLIDSKIKSFFEKS
jgi:Fe-S cluster assembly protein SufD